MPKLKTIANEIKAESEIEEKTVAKAKLEPEPKKKVFDQSDGIKCRSVVEGGLYMEGLKTQMLYAWTEYGDISEVEYRDLAAAVRSKSKFVYNPWFIIEDEDFLAEFPQVKKFYNDSYSIKELRDILQLPIGEMVETIKKLPESVMDTMKSIAGKQVASGQLDSVRKIKALDEIFGTDLNLIGGLFDE